MVEVENEEGRRGVLEEKSIHLVNLDVDVYILNNEKKEFLDACIDAGASMSPVGREQVEAY